MSTWSACAPHPSQTITTLGSQWKGSSALTSALVHQPWLALVKTGPSKKIHVIPACVARLPFLPCGLGLIYMQRLKPCFVIGGGHCLWRAPACRSVWVCQVRTGGRKFSFPGRFLWLSTDTGRQLPLASRVTSCLSSGAGAFSGALLV